jgi:Ran GTPase-activating protein (RanGAP) involved in mRNA processing and transport
MLFWLVVGLAATPNCDIGDLQDLGLRPTPLIEFAIPTGCTSLTIRDRPMTLTEVKDLADALFTNTVLQRLDLPGGFIGHKGLEVLASAIKQNPGTKLNSLDLSSNNLGPDAEQAFADLLAANTVLQRLDLGDNDLTGEDLATGLKSNTGLTYLNLENNKLTPEGIIALAGAVKLHFTLGSLTLTKNEIPKEAEAAIGDMLKTNSVLTKLYLNSTGITGEELSIGLKSNTKLNTLNLKNNNLGYDGVLAITSAIKANTGTKLTYLDLSSTNIGPDAESALADMLNAAPLQTLFLTSNDLTGTAFAGALKPNANLHILWVPDNKIGAEGATALSNKLGVFTALKVLNLGSNEIPPEQVDDIKAKFARSLSLVIDQTCDLADLNSAFEVPLWCTGLDLSSAQMGDDDFKTMIATMIATLGTQPITKLDLSSNGLTFESMLTLCTYVQTNTKITSINLSRNAIGAAGAIIVAFECVKDHPWLTNLDLSLNEIDMFRGDTIAAMFGSFSVGLNDFDVSQNLLDAATVTHIKDAALGLTTVTHSPQYKMCTVADLVDFAVGATCYSIHTGCVDQTLNEESVAKISTSLQTNTVLKALYLDHCGISDVGVNALASAITNNPQTALLELSLVYNGVGPAAEATLAAMLSAPGSKLTALILGNNDLTGETFAATLTGNTALTTLGMSNNKITTAAAKVLATKFSLLSSLASVHLAGNAISEEGVAVVKAAFGALLGPKTLLIENQTPPVPPVPPVSPVSPKAPSAPKSSGSASSKSPTAVIVIVVVLVLAAGVAGLVVYVRRLPAKELPTKYAGF